MNRQPPILIPFEQRSQDLEVLREKLLERTQISDGCWMWMGFKSRGYGYFTFKANWKKAVHWWWLVEHKQLPPKGTYFCHRCDNPPCVNPQHIFLGSARANVEDCIKKGRNKKPPVHKGEDSKFSKLTEKDISEIRKLSRLALTQTDIANMFNTTKQNISLIQKGETWKDIR